jgi:serine/threonine-protein kinase PpkA
MVDLAEFPIHVEAARLARRPDTRPHDIDGYRIQRQIGNGRTATIYLAEERRSGEAVALKLPHDLGQDRDRALRRLAAECAILGAIRDRHVVRVHGQQVLGEPPYLAMEYLAGGTLRRHMGVPMPAEEALSLVRQAALGLAAVHRLGIVHRDVKPENFLLRSCGTLVLADFGVAARQGDSQARVSAGQLVGTLCYAAPEQVQGSAPDASADVYGLGVVFYEMLCGHPPFAGKTALEVLAQHLVAPVPRLPGSLARYQPLIDRMLDKQARRRPADAAAVLDEIQRLEPARAHRN